MALFGVIWLLAGMICVVTACIYDYIYCGIKHIGKKELKAMGMLILFGLVSIPITTHFLYLDIKENKQGERKKKQRR